MEHKKPFLFCQLLKKPWPWPPPSPELPRASSAAASRRLPLLRRYPPAVAYSAAFPQTTSPPLRGGLEEPWEEAEAKILRDIEPAVKHVKDILHSRRYGDGALLSPDDEKVIVEKILAYHPRSEDKIGCGLQAIMVNKHPEFKTTRCLILVRTNGDLEDFSYRKCLRAYVERAYPSHADRFIAKHLGQKWSTLFRPPPK